jgi:quercetin dioxygenase-like cupin family protein
MYEISDRIKEQPYQSLKVVKMAKTDAYEILGITLEKGCIFPEHSSPTEAHLIVLEGDVDFYIDQKKFHLKTQQHFNFPKETLHWVEALSDSKFIIIR